MLEGTMKICMPVANANGMESEVFGHFGSAPFFALYDTESQRLEFVDNGLGEHEHGACMPVAALRQTGAQAVICKGMGMRAASLLLQAGITPYLVASKTVGQAVADYRSGNVRQLDASTACQHHGCH
jgi:predicted Fe-Mo cluster-binding NifX family protein